MAVSGIFTPRNTPKRHRRALQPFPPCQRFDVCRIRRQSIRRPFDRGEHRTPRHHRTRRPCRDRAPMIPATWRPCNRSGLSAISGKPSAVAIYPATSNAAPPSNAANVRQGFRRTFRQCQRRPCAPLMSHFANVTFCHHRTRQPRRACQQSAQAVRQHRTRRANLSGKPWRFDVPPDSSPVYPATVRPWRTSNAAPPSNAANAPRPRNRSGDRSTVANIERRDRRQGFRQPFNRCEHRNAGSVRATIGSGRPCAGFVGNLSATIERGERAAPVCGSTVGKDSGQCRRIPPAVRSTVRGLSAVRPWRNRSTVRQSIRQHRKRATVRRIRRQPIRHHRTRQPFAPIQSGATSNAATVQPCASLSGKPWRFDRWPRRIPATSNAASRGDRWPDSSATPRNRSRFRPVSGSTVRQSIRRPFDRGATDRPCASLSGKPWRTSRQPIRRPCASHSGEHLQPWRTWNAATYPATSNAANGKQNAAPHIGTRRNLSGKPWRHLAAPDSTKPPRPCV